MRFTASPHRPLGGHHHHLCCTPAPGGASAACSELSSSLPSSIVLTPSSSSYASAQNGGYNPLNNVLSPSCIIQPATSAHVATAMRSIFRNQANYAVRSGGHTGMRVGQRPGRCADRLFLHARLFLRRDYQHG